RTRSPTASRERVMSSWARRGITSSAGLQCVISIFTIDNMLDLQVQADFGPQNGAAETGRRRPETPCKKQAANGARHGEENVLNTGGDCRSNRDSGARRTPVPSYPSLGWRRRDTGHAARSTRLAPRAANQGLLQPGRGRQAPGQGG